MLTLNKAPRLTLDKALRLTLDKAPQLTLRKPSHTSKPMSSLQVFNALRGQSRNSMTSSKIIFALDSGKQVYWTSLRYSVKLDRTTGKLHVKDAYSDYYSGLQPSEVRDCFIR